MARGTLRIYLGASPGVGKTYTMLGEGVRRKERGTDIVVGVVETHGRSQTAGQIRDLEVIPLREVSYRGTVLKEMDVHAILRRNSRVVLVDEYAHTNALARRTTSDGKTSNNYSMPASRSSRRSTFNISSHSTTSSPRSRA